MPTTTRVGAPCALAALALLVASASAAAAPKRISGKLSRPGYTVIAVAATGEAKSVRATPRFRLRPPAKLVSLHLRGPNGAYAGPVVVDKRKRGRRAIVGVKRGARLGRVRVRARKGYATANPADKWIDPTRKARARRGVPIGAGKFGLVRSKTPRIRPLGDHDADGIADPLDVDYNGNRVLDRYERQPGGGAAASSGSVPAATASAVVTLEVQVLGVNGDDSVEARLCGPPGGTLPARRWPAGSPTPSVGAVYSLEVDFTGDAETSTLLSVSGPIDEDCPPPPPPIFIPTVSSGLMLTLKDTVNANVSALTVADIDATLAERGTLFLHGPQLGGVSVELDCAPNPDNPGGRTSGLTYCTPGGTGRVSPTPFPGTAPRSFPLAFPDCCDDNENGFGELRRLDRDEAPIGIVAFFSHGATTDEIGTGDILNWRVKRSGAENAFPFEDGEYPSTLPSVIATVPALVSYRDGAGNSGVVSYPVPPPYVGSSPDFLGPFEGPYHGFPVAPCPAGAPSPCEEGDVVLTLEFWRPQREAIAGVEAGEWIDIGGLVYSPGFTGPWTPAPDADPLLPSLPACALDDVSTTDPRFTPEEVMTPFSRGYGFRDSAVDRPADRGNMLSFSVNVTDCLASTTTTIRDNDDSRESGQNVSMWLAAGTGQDGDSGNTGATQQLLFTME